MELYIYNKELDLLGVLDTANAVIWNRRYYAPGEFEIHTAATEIALYLIQKQYLVAKPDSVEFGIIENVTIEQTETGEFIKATGRLGSSYLARRIVFETTIISDTVENAMRSLVYDNVINPVIAARAIPNIELGTLNSFAETVQFQVSYRNLLSTLTGLAETSGIGYRLRFDPALQKFYFETYKALDRSAGQSVNSRAIFSNDYDNLLTSLYQTSDIEISNVALVGGEGEGADRKMVVVGTGSGADRYEVFVNAKEVRMEDGITEPDYYAMLAQKGAESLLPSIEYFEGSVLPEGNLIYKTDYDLGDIVTIENIKWNKRIDVQITEITEVYDEYGARTLIPIFGQATPTLADALSGSKDTSGSGGGGIAVTANRALVSDSAGNASASSVTDTELGYLTGVTSNLQIQLNAKQATITGGASTIVSSNLTVNRALVSDASGKVAVSAVTSTELGYLSGVTSAIQTQLNAKQATITGGASTIVSSNLTANRALLSDASGKVAVSAVTSTELAYLDGVTSAIQTQLNGKAATAHTHAAADLPNNVVVLWDSTLSAAGTVTLSQAVTNFDFILVEAALDNASNENRVSGMYYSKNGLRSNVRAYTVDASISTGNLAYINFSFPSATQIRYDGSGGSLTRSLKQVIGIKIV